LRMERLLGLPVPLRDPGRVNTVRRRR
jgi:hypothetical protein